VRSREERKKEGKWGGSERHYIWEEGVNTISPILKIPWQCPLVLVEIMHIGINFL
jgi:hypothetical protein